MNRESVDARIYEQLQELKRQERPCLITLQETVVAAKDIKDLDKLSAPLPRIRVISTNQEIKDIPLSMIERVDTVDQTP